MKEGVKMNILYINACVRKDSRTNELAQYTLKKLQGDIKEINLKSTASAPALTVTI